MLNKKKVLGRGLGALIGEAQAPREQKEGKENFFLCPIVDISPNRAQPRKTFDEVKLKELCDSIKEKGIIEPLVVRRTTDGYELIAGERRWRASRMAGLTEVPVVVLNANDTEALELAIIENIQREDLNAIEEAESYKSLMAFGLTQDEVAVKVGKERATVANYLRLLKLPIEVRDEIVKGNISMGHARALLSIEGHSAQVEACRAIITKGLSVREAESIANRGGTKPVKKKGAVGQGQGTEVEDELRGIFGTKVALKERSGKGRIEINYYSADERERVIELLRSVSGS
ncbi:MAG: ParB/RepB/Spo0J family partition protein [Deltaproteobacteria bacterium]|nr:ParB/RepB/Spo0J family partition protein [Deltaproteobacteria bacterium]